jgi:hypothetical protein
VKGRKGRDTWSSFAVFAGCVIISSTSFQPRQGDDVTCVRGPWGALYTYLSLRLRSDRR